MKPSDSADLVTLRAEIACAAARMIAEEGASYGAAKRKAAQQLVGSSKIHGDFLPDNAEIEDEVRIYQQLFFGDTQPARLMHLRKLALQLMTEFAEFSPCLTGAVWNGTAGAHSDIHLQLFCDSPKDVEIFALNQNISYDVSETSHFRQAGETVETLSFIWHNEGVHLTLYSTDDLRGALKSNRARMERGDINKVGQLIEESSGNE